MYLMKTKRINCHNIEIRYLTLLLVSLECDSIMPVPNKVRLCCDSLQSRPNVASTMRISLNLKEIHIKNHSSSIPSSFFISFMVLMLDLLNVEAVNYHNMVFK